MFRPIFCLICLISTSACVAAAAGGAAVGGVVMMKERTVGNAVNDSTIHSKILLELADSDSKEAFDGVNVEVMEGRVLLTGVVKNPENAIFAVKAAWSVDGVREVMNEIQVGNRKGLAVSSVDTWITTKIKSKIGMASGISSLNYSFETVNGVVYVMGIAQSQHELDKVLHIVNNTDGVDKAVNYVRVMQGFNTSIPKGTKMPDGYDQQGKKLPEKPAETKSDSGSSSSSGTTSTVPPTGGITINMLPPPETKK